MCGCPDTGGVEMGNTVQVEFVLRTYHLHGSEVLEAPPMRFPSEYLARAAFYELGQQWGKSFYRMDLESGGMTLGTVVHDKQAGPYAAASLDLDEARASYERYLVGKRERAEDDARRKAEREAKQQDEV